MVQGVRLELRELPSPSAGERELRRQYESFAPGELRRQ